MRSNSTIVCGLCGVLLAVGSAGCASQKQSAAPAQSHAEIWASHRSENVARNGDTIVFAIGDTLGAKVYRDHETAQDRMNAFTVARGTGFVAGDSLGAMNIQSPTLDAVAGVDDDR